MNAAQDVFSKGNLPERFNNDPEFRINARYWNGALEFGIDSSSYVLTLTNGVITSLDSASTSAESHVASSAPGRVRIGAPASDWEIFLRDPAPPFYLDYYSASLHHGFDLSGDPDTLWAYYPAIRRTSELLREIAKNGGAR